MIITAPAALNPRAPTTIAPRRHSLGRTSTLSTPLFPGSPQNDQLTIRSTRARHLSRRKTTAAQLPKENAAERKRVHRAESLRPCPDELGKRGEAHERAGRRFGAGPKSGFRPASCSGRWD